VNQNALGFISSEGTGDLRSGKHSTLNVQLEKAGDGVDEKGQDDGVEAKREHALHQG